ncbi:MAG: cell division protein FtsZ [Rikenellaceae bacterium]|jgi:cell division protein FtsZ|nr:cell division protein FtsZ [Rikenellaceae bacterium]
MTNIIDFHLPQATPSIIMVAGVGGGGSNAVNHMYHLGITDVSFMVCNTDIQALNRSQIPIKVVLGESLTQGLGAGNKPERGRAAAEESYDQIVEIFQKHGTRMVFVTAGMGGGTGTGAAPVIAKAARDLGILTIAIVTIPFKTEGRKRFNQALEGIEEIRKYVDSLLVINNENILEMHGQLVLSEAFGQADDILATAAKGIAEIITGNSYINVDFADVQTVMKESGVALMGSAQAGGENRADEAVRAALASPLLNHQDISGARNILLNITSGAKEITLEETYRITDYVQEKTGYVADLIWGAGKDDSLGDEIKVTIIATGYDNSSVEDFLEESREAGAKRFDRQRQTEEETETQAEETTSPEDTADAPETVAAETPKKSYPVIEPEQPFRPRPRPEGVVSVQSRSGVAGRSTVVADNDSGYIVVERQETPAVAQEENAINYDELERSPAWLRRKMTFADTASDEKGASRVTLKEDSKKQDKPQPPNGDLFD